MSSAAEVVCGAEADRCICVGALDHEGPHVCDCGGQWLGTYGPGSTDFKIVRLPGPFGGGEVRPRGPA